MIPKNPGHSPIDKAIQARRIGTFTARALSARPRQLAFLLPALIGLAFTCAANATSYYLDSVAGNDNNAGTSPATAWKSIAKVNKKSFSPGDQVLFNGGQTFSGNMTFSNTDSGAAGNPVTVSSYGTGRANISAATGDGIKLTSASYITITNINVSGPGWNVNNGGHGVVLGNSSNHCLVNNITASGFQKAGVLTDSPSHDNTISYVVAQQNGFLGFDIEGTTQLVTDCKALSNNGDTSITNNWSGSGILASSAHYVTIQYCEAASNGGQQPWTGNGPAGIWCWNADHITIANCIAHNNLRGHGNSDGDGFDMDGGTTDSVIEYCYSYNNVGFGYLQYNFAWQSITHQNNTIRYCISENDGQGGIAFGTSGLGLVNDAAYNNVCFNTNGATTILDTGGAETNVSVRNNVFLTNGTLSVGNTAFALQGNCYYSTAGRYGFGSYGSNFVAWANGTGKEIYNGQIVGLNENPGLTDVGTGTKLTDPRQLPTLRSYSAASGFAAVIDMGLDLSTLFGINPGTVDMIGASIPVRSFDMGAYEFQGQIPSDTTPPTVAMTAPTDGSIVSGTAVTVSGTATDNVGGSGVAGVQFQLDGANLGAEDTTAPYSITWNSTLTANGFHTLTAVARDGVGNSAVSTTVTVTVNNTAPAAPSGLTATASPTSINLAWTDNSTNESGFNILRSTDGVNFSVIAVTAANVTSYSDYNVASYTTYYYQLEAYNVIGNSTPSNTASATTGNTSGPVGWWKFDESSGTTTADSSGNGITGTLAGSPAPTWTTGTFNNALNFNGTSAYVTMSNGSTTGPLKPSSLPVTITGWIKLSGTTGNEVVFATDEWDAAVYAGCNLMVSGGKMSAQYGSAAGGNGPAYRRSKAGGATTMSIGQWYHVAVVIQGATNMQMYVNGTDDGGSYSGTGGTLGYTTATSKAGTAGIATFFNGVMDDVRVYNRALNAAEVAAIANGSL